MSKLQQNNFNQGDLVQYSSTGSLCNKYPEDIKRGKSGEVISKVLGSELLVVSFGSDDFLCHPDNLTRMNHHEKSEDNNTANDRAARKWARSSEENPDGKKQSKTTVIVLKG